MSDIKLTEEQQAVVDNRGGTLLVSAAAGSGKTKVLIERVLRRVEEGSNLDDFLIITFTNAAAAELREKLIVRLSEALEKDPENRHLQQQLSRVYLAQISTVHGFCSTLLREYAHTLDIPGDFRICDEQEADFLADRAMDQMLEKACAERGDDEELEETLLLLKGQRNDSTLSDLILSAYKNIRCWRNPEQRLQELADQLDFADCRDVSGTAWGKYLLDEMDIFLQNCEPVLDRACEELSADPVLCSYLPAFQSDLAQIRRLRKLGSWDEFQKEKLVFPRIAVIKNAPDVIRQEHFKSLRNDLKDKLRKRMADFADPSGTLISDMESSAGALRGLLKLVKRFGQSYGEIKLRWRVLDYNDLEQYTLRLLYQPSGGRTAAAKEIAERFTEIMVDEYQDTNGVQDAIFNAVSSGGNLFFVGDVKQSIYRFRLADPGIFLNKYKTYRDYRKAAEGESRKILLSDNFRSCPEILSAVNEVFRMNMTERTGGLDYGDPEALRANLPSQGGCPVELHCIDMENVSTQECMDRNCIESEFIARRISRMLKNGETITTGKGVRPIEPGDIAILMRSAANRTGTYVSALKRWKIPCDYGNDDLLGTEEISLLTALLRVIDNPHQDIPLLQVLLSPLFRYTAEDLALIRAERPGGDLYDALCQSEKGRRFTEKLTELRGLAGQMNIHSLLDEIDERLEFRNIFAQNAHNLDEFYTLAYCFETDDSYGLPEFLQYLDRLAEKGLQTSGNTEKRNAVQIVTMHRSKGLEYPVVFLADLYKRFNNEDSRESIVADPVLGLGSYSFDQEKGWYYPTVARRAIAARIRRENMSEEMRILYVAMTRARSRLVMTYCGAGMEKRLNDLSDKITLPLSENVIESAQCMGDWVVMTALTHPEAEELFRNGIQPKDFIAPQYPWSICYHDGQAYEPALTEEQPEAERQVNVPVLHETAYPHRAAAAAPSKVTATQLKGRTLDEEASEATVQGPQMHFDRPRFETGQKALTPTERGTAIHLAMQYLDYEKCRTTDEISAELQRLTEKKQLTPQQAEAVPPEKILNFFHSEIGKRVLSASRLEREFKFSVLEDGEILDQELKGEKILLQGVADCCIVEDDGITILDFKSDRIRPGEEAQRSACYRGQLDAYSRALSRIFGLPVKERILYFFATDTAWTVPE